MKTFNHPNYELDEKIGEGGMSVVYLAEHKAMRRPVAIKFLRQEYMPNDNIRMRFISEGRNMFAMDHPNIVRVHDLIDTPEYAAIVMEYVVGTTLKSYLERYGAMEDEDLKTFFGQMLAGVGYIHSKGYIHRDIKPSNFMVTLEGTVKLFDFGIAKSIDPKNQEHTATGTNQILGTPLYMSPEQVKESHTVTSLTDIYSLGVVLWQLVTGKRPYGDSLATFDLQLKIVNEPLGLTGTWWDEVILRACMKEPSQRFESCGEIQKAIAEKTNLKEQETHIETVGSKINPDLKEKDNNYSKIAKTEIQLSQEQNSSTKKNNNIAVRKNRLRVGLFVFLATVGIISISYSHEDNLQFIAKMFNLTNKMDRTIKSDISHRLPNSNSLIKAREYISELYEYLSRNEFMGNVNEVEFTYDMRDHDFARSVYDMMVSRKMIEDPKDFNFSTFYQPFITFYAESLKKSQSEIRAGLGEAFQVVSPISSNIDFTKSLSDVVRRTASLTKLKRKQNLSFGSVIEKMEANMIFVQGGTFNMGCTSEQGGDCEEFEHPVHKVMVSDFYIGKYEVTQAEWKEIMGSNPSYHQDCNDCPVEQVNWMDVQEFLEKLNAKTGKAYRLPSEVEWEYAARAGQFSKENKYAGSNILNEVAWYGENSENKPHPVGQKKANTLGINDMSGNVWEWCADDWHDDYNAAPSISRAWIDSPMASFPLRVYRGGSWSSGPLFCRVSFRLNAPPFFSNSNLGFRLTL
jgi:formylglycine-generating enzyme required for sulfatase activity/tRNA A-37 threonylcarbamoyl transferase component Bud32